MREPAMVIQAEGPAPEAADHVKVRGFRGKCERSGGKCRLAVDAGTAHCGAEEKMSDRFQTWGSVAP